MWIILMEIVCSICYGYCLTYMLILFKGQHRQIFNILRTLLTGVNSTIYAYHFHHNQTDIFQDKLSHFWYCRQFLTRNSEVFEFEKQTQDAICVKQHPLTQIQTNQNKQLQANQQSKQQKAKRTRKDQRKARLHFLWRQRSQRVSVTPSSICVQEIIFCHWHEK